LLLIRVALGAAGLIAVRLAVYAVLVQGDLGQGLCRFDCGWYLSIVTAGYDDAPHLVTGELQANWAFFPLFPLAVRAMRALTGLTPPLAGVAVANLALFGFALLGWRYRARTRPGSEAGAWLLALMAWPYGFYFSVPYSEAPYACLATAALLALAAGRAWLAAVATALLTATRPTGIVLAAWVGFERLWRARSQRRPAAFARAMAPALVAPLGLVGFMGFLGWRVGDPLAFAHIQAAWGHSLRNPLVLLLEAFVGRDQPGFHPGHYYPFLWAILGVAAAVSLRRHPAEAWLVFATVLMALLAGNVWSIPRFVAANPAFLFVVADRVEAIRSRRVRGIVLLLMAVLQAVLVRAWFEEGRFLI